MGRLGERDRSELESMRDTIVERMNTLQDQVDHGELTDTQRYAALEKEFGFDYLQTLSYINELLHKQHDAEHIVPKKLIASTFVLIVCALAVGTWATLSPTGFLIANNLETITLNTELSTQQSTLLELPEQTTIANIEISQDTTLMLEDASRTFTLYQNNRCIGCGQLIEQPYLLTNTGEQSTTIQSLEVKA